MHSDRIDTHEAAAILGRHVGTIANWRWCGVGPSWKRHRGRVYYSRREVLALAQRLAEADQ